MKKQHRYPSLNDIRESLQNLPPESKTQSTKKFLQQQKELVMPPNKLGYDNFDGLLISNFAGDIASFRF